MVDRLNFLLSGNGLTPINEAERAEALRKANETYHALHGCTQPCSKALSVSGMTHWISHDLGSHSFKSPADATSDVYRNAMGPLTYNDRSRNTISPALYHLVMKVEDVFAWEQMNEDIDAETKRELEKNIFLTDQKPPDAHSSAQGGGQEVEEEDDDDELVPAEGDELTFTPLVAKKMKKYVSFEPKVQVDDSYNDWNGCQCMHCSVASKDELSGQELLGDHATQEAIINALGERLMKPICFEGALRDIYDGCWDDCYHAITRHILNTARASNDILIGILDHLAFAYVKEAGLWRFGADIVAEAQRSFVLHVWDKSGMLEIDQCVGTYPANPFFLPFFVKLGNFRDVVRRFHKVRKTWHQVLPLGVKTSAELIQKGCLAVARGDWNKARVHLAEINEVFAHVLLAFWKYFDRQVLHLCSELLGRYSEYKHVATATVLGHDVSDHQRNSIAEDNPRRELTYYGRLMRDSLLPEIHAKIMASLNGCSEDPQFATYRIVHQMLLYHNWTRFGDEFRKIIVAKKYSGEHEKQELLSRRAREIDCLVGQMYAKDKKLLFAGLAGHSLCRSGNLSYHRVPTYLDRCENHSYEAARRHYVVESARKRGILTTGFAIDSHRQNSPLDAHHFTAGRRVSNMFKFRPEDHLLYGVFELLTYVRDYRAAAYLPPSNCFMRQGVDPMGVVVNRVETYPELRRSPEAIESDDGFDGMEEVEELKARWSLDVFHLRRRVCWTFIFYGSSDHMLEDLLQEILNTHNMMAPNKAGMWLFEANCVRFTRNGAIEEGFRMYSNPYIRQIMREYPRGCMQVKNIMLVDGWPETSLYCCAKRYCYNNPDSPHGVFQYEYH